MWVRRTKVLCSGYACLMADPRYRPQSYCAEPRAFGHAETVKWREVAPEEMVRSRTAQLQHLYAVRIRNRLRAKNRSLAGYAREVGSSYDRMTKVLRGVLPMRLDDIAAADIILGGVSEITPDASVPEAINTDEVPVFQGVGIARPSSRFQPRR